MWSVVIKIDIFLSFWYWCDISSRVLCCGGKFGLLGRVGGVEINNVVRYSISFRKNYFFELYSVLQLTLIRNDYFVKKMRVYPAEYSLNQKILRLWIWNWNLMCVLLYFHDLYIVIQRERAPNIVTMLSNIIWGLPLLLLSHTLAPQLFYQTLTSSK